MRVTSALIEVEHCCRERRWKIAQAKRFAKLVSKSNLDVEGRERLRRREELLNLKKRAAWIAKEVMQHAVLFCHVQSNSWL
jgi:hypothetical protein